jgi:6-pyruvoyltetrahydropterin/6-carboxytetrahydropterin synthase
LPQLDRIDLYQTPGCGAVLSWGQHGPALPL